MFKNMDYQDTYSKPEFANVRYPSTATKSINGWAYIRTKDDAYVYDLSQHHLVEVRFRDHWIKYVGELYDNDDLELDSPANEEEDESDPYY